MIEVVIVARLPALRRGLRALIESDAIRVVGEEATLANGSFSDRPHADVLIVADPGWLPERVVPGTAIVAVGDNERLPARVAGLEAAGWAVVPADVSAELLRAAVVAAARGMVLVPASEMRGAPFGRGVRVEQDDDIATVDEALTSREREVLELLVSGLTNREIAQRLTISEHTVKFHLSTIYGKLGAATRTEAVRRAVLRGLVTL